MDDTDEGPSSSRLPRRTRRLFLQSTGLAGLGLSAGSAVVSSQEDEDGSDDSTVTGESEDCPSTELEPGSHKFTPDDVEPDDEFGVSVSVAGDTAIVGQGNRFENSSEEDFASGPATAYVFTYDGDRWCQQAKLVADEGGSDSDDEDQYGGTAVSLDGDTAVLGDGDFDGDELKSGAAFVFTRDGETWSQQAKVTADDPDRYDRFGRELSLDGDRLLVGVSLDDEREFNAGAAYVFVRDGETWSQEAKITPDDAANNHYFGTSVALDGDTALVGEALDDQNGTWSGAAYVFTRDGGSWSQQVKLLADDGTERDQFGSAVTLDDGTAVVGAPNVDDNADDAGAAYVFDQDGGGSWTQRAKLLADEGATREQFGWSVALNDDRAIVGTWDWTQAGITKTGRAYSFTRDGGSWSQEATLLPPDGEGRDLFGRVVALHGERAVVGAMHSGETGAAYAFHYGTWEPTDPGGGDPGDGEPTEIDSCTVIEEPGEYELVADLAPGEIDQPACITIDSRDVTFRGNGHTIDASNATHSPDTSEGDVSEGYERPPCIAVHPYTNGLGESNWNTLVEDVVVRGGLAGVAARLTHSERYRDVTAVDNDHGFLFESASGVVENCLAEDNDRGVTPTAKQPYSGGRVAVTDCTLRANGTGLWVGQEMEVTADGSRIVLNGTGVRAEPITQDFNYRRSTVSIEECHLCRNENYGVHADLNPPAEDDDADAEDREDVVLAIDNYWGATDGPSSFGDPEEPFTDPETGRPADGAGDAVSQSLEPGVSNVRFDPFHEATLDDVGADR